MAKPKKLPLPNQVEPSEALAQAKVPAFRWNIIAQIALVLVVVWVLAFAAVPYVSYWGVGIVAALTLLMVGFGGYAWRMTARQKELMSVLSQATDEAGRKAAIAQLEAKGSKDALAAMARAQLVLRESPREGLAILESIDLSREPGPVQDEVRSNLAFLYLSMGRPKDARPVVDLMRLDRQPNAKAKAMYAAVMSETFARTGKAEDARKLLDTYSADDPEYGEVQVLLLRAQVFTYLATKNRGLMRKAMLRLAERDPNQLAPFLQKTAALELQQAAKDTLAQAGFQTRPKQKVQRT